MVDARTSGAGESVPSPDRGNDRFGLSFIIVGDLARLARGISGLKVVGERSKCATEYRCEGRSTEHSEIKKKEKIPLDEDWEEPGPCHSFTRTDRFVTGVTGRDDGAEPICMK